MTKAKTNAELCRDWYRRNKARKYEMSVRRKQDLARYVDDIKRESGCSRCGERDPACLVFHHRKPSSKRFHVAIGAEGRVGLVALQKEIAKCDVLCANCHLKHHWEERQRAKPKRTR